MLSLLLFKFIICFMVMLEFELFKSRISVVSLSYFKLIVLLGFNETVEDLLLVIACNESSKVSAYISLSRLTTSIKYSLPFSKKTSVVSDKEEPLGSFMFHREVSE